MSDVKPIRKALAEKTLTAMRKQFAAYLDGDHPDNSPILRTDDRNGHWEIVWESGPYDWPQKAFAGGWDSKVFHQAKAEGLSTKDASALASTPAKVPCPAGVFTEPVNSYTLGLYPAWD